MKLNCIWHLITITWDVSPFLWLLFTLPLQPSDKSTIRPLAQASFICILSHSSHNVLWCLQTGSVSHLSSFVNLSSLFRVNDEKNGFTQLKNTQSLRSSWVISQQPAVKTPDRSYLVNKLQHVKICRVNKWDTLSLCLGPLLFFFFFTIFSPLWKIH